MVSGEVGGTWTQGFSCGSEGDPWLGAQRWTRELSPSCPDLRCRGGKGGPALWLCRVFESQEAIRMVTGSARRESGRQVPLKSLGLVLRQDVWPRGEQTNEQAGRSGESSNVFPTSLKVFLDVKSAWFD